MEAAAPHQTHRPQQPLRQHQQSASATPAAPRAPPPPPLDARHEDAVGAAASRGPPQRKKLVRTAFLPANDPPEPAEPFEPAGPSEPSEPPEPPELAERPGFPESPSSPDVPYEDSPPPASEPPPPSSPSPPSSDPEPEAEPDEQSSRPPLEKMTIRINRGGEPRAASEEPQRVEQVPKVTIKLVKPAAEERPPEDREENDGALKMTIKLSKDAAGDASPSRQPRRRDRCSPERPVVPKLTIKIPPEHETRQTEQARRSPAPRLTIKPIVRPTDDGLDSRNSPARDARVPSPESKLKFLLSEGSSKPNYAIEDPHLVEGGSSRMIFKMRPSSEDYRGSPSRLGYKIYSAPHDVEENDRPSKSGTPNRTSEHAHESVPKVTIKPIPVPEEMSRPLEIETSPYRCSGQSESGQESPRIILKINKTFQGSTTEILTEKTQKKPDEDDFAPSNAAEPLVPKLTIKIPQDNLEEKSGMICELLNENDDASSNLPSPISRIKLKLTRDGCTKIVNEHCNSTFEATKDSINRTPRTSVKRSHAKEDSADATGKHSNVDVSGSDAKRLKFDKMFSNSNITITRVAKPKSELENLLVLDDKPELTVSLVPLNSNKEKVSPSPNRRRNTRIGINQSRSKVSAIDAIVKLPDFVNRIRIAKNEKVPGPRRYKRNSKFTKDNIDVSEIDSDAVSSLHNDMDDEMDRVGPQSPVFNDTGDIIALNEGSSSQECMIIDDLSQDPLDIDSIAKSHFVPVTSNVNNPVNNNIVNIIAQSPSSLLTPQPRRGRGRPRKSIIEPLLNSSIVTSTVDERTLRNSKRSREPAITRTPRGRGRGRGRRGAVQNSHEFPSKSNSFFSNSGLFNNSMEENELSKETECEKSELKSIEMEINNLLDDSDDESADSDMSASGNMSPLSENMSEINSSSFGRGRNRGRGVRGTRRTRGGRVIRANRGSRGGRNARGSKCVEEVQLQDAMPTKVLKENKRSKSKAVLSSSVQMFEEETCMMGDNENLKNTNLIEDESQITEMIPFPIDIDKSKRSLTSELYSDGNKDWSPADVAEYDWPPEGCSTESPPQTYMIQEQVALYLGIKSFKRKYPDLNRRNLEPEEKAFLKERGLVSETMCDLGITAVDAGEVLDIMFTDFPNKYEEYRQYLRENRDNRASNKPPAHLATERSKQETLERARESASSWNARLNRQRRTVRSAAMDLQTLTLHCPRKPQTVSTHSISSYYPVALLPGQFTDYYKSYTPDELRYFPLNTVLNVISSPMRTDEGADSPSEESAEESDIIESSSDESGSESSERNFKRKNVSSKSRKIAADINSAGVSRSSSPTTANQSQVSLPPPPVEVPRCKLCSGTEHANRRYPSETFITCATCLKKVHPSCLEMAPNVAKCVRLYAWQCADCKCCAQCQDLADDDKMLFCDLCDRGYHIYCVGLKRVPTGRWHCSHCAVCRSCGSRTPSGLPGAPPAPISGPPDQWHHHLKKGSSGQKVYSHTLCGPCARAWRAGRYCSLCERCFMGKKGALKVVICVNCDRTHHKECVRQPGRALDVLNYMCNGCRRGNTPRRHFTPKKFTNTPKRAPPPLNVSTTNSNRNKVNNHSQREAASSMDVSIDSICTIDSNHQSNSTSCDGVFEDIKNAARNEVLSGENSYSKNAIVEKQSEELSYMKLPNKIEKNVSNNHVVARVDSVLAKNDKNVNSNNSVNKSGGKSIENDINSSGMCKVENEIYKKNISQVTANTSESVHQKVVNTDLNSVNVITNDKLKSDYTQSNDLIQTENSIQKNAVDNLSNIKVNFDDLSDNT